MSQNMAAPRYNFSDNVNCCQMFHHRKQRLCNFLTLTRLSDRRVMQVSGSRQFVPLDRTAGSCSAFPERGFQSSCPGTSGAQGEEPLSPTNRPPISDRRAAVLWAILGRLASCPSQSELTTAAIADLSTLTIGSRLRVWVKTKP